MEGERDDRRAAGDGRPEWREQQASPDQQERDQRDQARFRSHVQQHVVRMLHRVALLVLGEFQLEAPGADAGPGVIAHHLARRDPMRGAFADGVAGGALAVFIFQLGEVDVAPGDRAPSQAASDQHRQHQTFAPFDRRDHDQPDRDFGEGRDRAA